MTTAVASDSVASVATTHHCGLVIAQRSVPEVSRRSDAGAPIKQAEVRDARARAGSSEAGGFAKRGHLGCLVRLKGWPLNVPLKASWRVRTKWTARASSFATSARATALGLRRDMFL